MRWFAVQTKPGRETVAEANLLQQGFEAYLPRYRRQISHARRRTTVKAPLFPGYLFVRLDLDTCRWRAINGTLGAIGLVCFGDRPTSLGDEVVDAIRAREDKDGLIELVRADELSEGDRVAVESGAMSGMTGVFMTAKDTDRVVVLFKLMGRDVNATVRQRQLRRAV